MAGDRVRSGGSVSAASSSSSLPCLVLLAAGLLVLVVNVPHAEAAGMSWTPWSPFGACSNVSSCGVRGAQTRRRSCQQVAGDFPSTGCSGNDTELRLCDVAFNCTGNWTMYSPWTPCTSVCNRGEQWHFRTCRAVVAGVTAPSCMDDGSGYAEMRGCPITTVSPPLRAELTIKQWPASFIRGEVGVLVCCVNPMSAASNVQLNSGPQKSVLLNRTGLLILNTAGRTEALFSSLQDSDAETYNCGTDQISIDSGTRRVTVSPPPATAPMATRVNGVPTTRTPVRPTTGGAATTTASVDRDNRESDDDSYKLWVGIFVPVGLIVIVAVTILSTIIWRRCNEDQVLVGRREIGIDEPRFALSGTSTVAVLKKTTTKSV